MVKALTCQVSAQFPYLCIQIKSANMNSIERTKQRWVRKTLTMNCPYRLHLMGTCKRIKRQIYQREDKNFIVFGSFLETCQGLTLKEVTASNKVSIIITLTVTISIKNQKLSRQEEISENVCKI